MMMVRPEVDELEDAFKFACDASSPFAQCVMIYFITYRLLYCGLSGDTEVMDKQGVRNPPPFAALAVYLAG